MVALATHHTNKIAPSQALPGWDEPRCSRIPEYWFDESFLLPISSYPAPERSDTCLTARSLLHSGLIGLWKERTDIDDSTVYARQLREQAQNRRR